ncbi:MAG TPA: mechanosensitive ion channel family protein [Burkholderiales bacterium]|nr:mechanosensitive ion channel family protein [Burkholderiales bacterium]
MDFDLDRILSTATALLTAFGLKIVGAIVAWFVGRYLIKLSVRLMSAAMRRQLIDATLTRYLGNIINVALTIGLIVALMGYFGFETTSFAALIAGVGLAIGAAWAGLLANFAAGAFLIVLRPFKVGDYVKISNVEGTVKEIGIFSTMIESADHVVAYIGNNKIFSDIIHNFSASPTRRVERTAQLAHGVDVNDAIRRLKEAIVKIPNVAKAPAPVVEIVDFTTRGPVLAIRPYTHNDNYWQVYFDTNKAICDTFGEAGYPIPTEHVQNVRNDRPAAPQPSLPSEVKA